MSERSAGDTAARRALGALGLDIAAVIVFVAIGRRSHDESGNAVTGALAVAAPFLIGVGIGWLAGRVWLRPMALVSGAVVWVATAVIGLVLRRFVFDRGTALAFVIVATISLGVLLVGWRVLGGVVKRPQVNGEPARK